MSDLGQKKSLERFQLLLVVFSLNNFLFEINIGLFPEIQIITESVESKRKTLEKFQFTTSKTVLAE